MLTAESLARWMPRSRWIAVCAVSGGLDSMCLLHLLHSWCQAHGGQLSAAHFNHCLRGAESRRDEDFVRELARSLGVEYPVGRADVRHLRRQVLVVVPPEGQLHPVALLQGVAGCPMGNHRGVSPVTGPVPDVGALGDDRARDRFEFRVHETGEMHVGVERRIVAFPVAQEGEKGIDIFSLVVRPDGGIIRLSAWSVHVASSGLEYALRGSDLGEAELPVYHIVRSIKIGRAHV